MPAILHSVHLRSAPRESGGVASSSVLRGLLAASSEAANPSDAVVVSAGRRERFEPLT